MMYGPAKSVSDTYPTGLHGKQIRNGVEQWYHYGAPHRTDGPAMPVQTQMAWWWYGIPYTFTHWLEINSEISEEEKVMLKLKYG
jgi:hypothetical protein